MVTSLGIDTKEELKTAIVSALPYGKERAIIGKVLANLIGIRATETELRGMRRAIKELRHDRVLIGLSVHKPFGYYLIQNVDELKECMATLKGYCVEAAYARRDLKLAGRALLEPGQLPLM
ncbi:hypothetical protein LCGC14_0861670 [marine sediment metagenome]|uniref:Uncharacterized protein n=1 Tax=marine sediment metagenome TaxID=412755 RepID=A0A0F9RRS4_9ZZZZ